jgi:TolB-like protein
MTRAGAGHFDVIGNAAILRGPRSARDLPAISKALGADYVVLGQVQQDAHGMRILAHLIALPEQTHIQVVRSDFSSGEALKSQLETARQVAAEFAKPLIAGRRTR